MSLRLVDVHHTLSVTAAAKNPEESAQGQMHVQLQLDVEEQRSVTVPAVASVVSSVSRASNDDPSQVVVVDSNRVGANNNPIRERVSIDLSVQQFYGFLSALEEAKAAYVSASADK